LPIEPSRLLSKFLALKSVLLEEFYLSRRPLTAVVKACYTQNSENSLVRGIPKSSRCVRLEQKDPIAPIRSRCKAVVSESEWSKMSTSNIQRWKLKILASWERPTACLHFLFSLGGRGGGEGGWLLVMQMRMILERVVGWRVIFGPRLWFIK
jgi:hypothetical protein